jgi:hypothetical protein
MSSFPAHQHRGPAGPRQAPWERKRHKARLLRSRRSPHASAGGACRPPPATGAAQSQGREHHDDLHPRPQPRTWRRYEPRRPRARPGRTGPHGSGAEGRRPVNIQGLGNQGRRVTGRPCQVREKPGPTRGQPGHANRITYNRGGVSWLPEFWADLWDAVRFMFYPGWPGLGFKRN